MRVIKKIFFTLIIVISLMISIFVWFAKSNNKDYGDNNKIMKSNRSNTKKALVIYQPSRFKVTDKIAEKIAGGIKDEGYDVTLNYPGSHLSNDISQYSIVVFGSPVYIGQISSTLTDYMKRIKNYEDKKVLIFATGSQLNNGEVDKIGENLSTIKATEKINFKNGNKDEDKAYEIGKKIAGE
ncbi:Flavodoxin domain-containing protein [Clostridium cavendishii DSM 21758]|uniref:Flavodoxin domain-containing protein n=1 Tax=Clostridium cavendishii DSM 21758 TaxID=1121302 RepID=A0A1M6F6S0_9CLOT|nr:flavodoxin domain-containing protein [Clostridium cavendishii]SHI93346.1 Flavodoxin domain-containing protein [Clostridium cavendishii DSM 21758]